jgi:hypothetical protein
MQHPIDPELKYCPQCGDEYRVEIIACAACAISLISGKAIIEQRQQREEKQAARRPISPDDKLVNIQKGPVLQMQMVQSVLKRAGIPSLIVNESGSCGQGCCGPSLVIQIRMSDLEDAQAVLAEDYIRSTGLHDHDLSAAGAVFDTEVDSALCPACGCYFSTTQNSCPDCGLCFS